MLCVPPYSRRRLGNQVQGYWSALNGISFRRSTPHHMSRERWLCVFWAVNSTISMISLFALASSSSFRYQGAETHLAVFHHHNSTSLPRPLASFSSSGVAKCSLDARVLQKSGQWFEFSVWDVVDPKDDDWVAVYAPAIDPIPVMPVKYFLADIMEGYLETGSGVFRVRLFNHRTETMRIGLMRGFRSDPVTVAMSPTIKVANVNEPTHGHLAMTGKEGEMLVQWTTKDRGSPKTMWGTQSNEYTHSMDGDSTTYTNNKEVGIKPGMFHKALMTGLEPGKKYYYKYGDEEFGFSDEFSFVTPPAVGPQSAFKFVALGDMGSKEKRFWRQSVKTMKLLEAEVDAQLIMHNGDVGYARGKVTAWDIFMDGIQPMATRIPYMTSPGNHDRDCRVGDRFHGVSQDSLGQCGIPYKARFGMPTAEGNQVYWYSFDFGPVHFLIFDTEDDFSPGSDQYKFIVEDLEKADRSKTPWIIPVGHRPVYITSTDERPVQGDNVVAKDLQRDLEPLFYKAQVRLVLQAHNHSYQRTCPVFKKKCRRNSTAPVYIDVGNGGASLNLPPEEHPEYIEVASAEHGLSRFRVNGTDLWMESLRSSNGTLIDAVHIKADPDFSPPEQSLEEISK